jgi:hypothetical protein
LIEKKNENNKLITKSKPNIGSEEPLNRKWWFILNLNLRLNQRVSSSLSRELLPTLFVILECIRELRVTGAVVRLCGFLEDQSPFNLQVELRKTLIIFYN